jgi:hypothetical protein
VLNQCTADIKPPAPPDQLTAVVRGLIVETARQECLVRQRSMILSLADDRPALVDGRARVEIAAGELIVAVCLLAVNHGIQPLEGMSGEEINLIAQAIAPLDREEGGA